jgi:hypothetical protein
VVGHSDAVPDHSTLGFDADPVVDGGSNALLAAEVITVGERDCCGESSCFQKIEG